MISRTSYKMSAWVTTISLKEGDSFIEVCFSLYYNVQTCNFNSNGRMSHHVTG